MNTVLHSNLHTSSLAAGRGGGGRARGCGGGGGKSGLPALSTGDGPGLTERFSLGGTGRGADGLGTTYFLLVGVGEDRGEVRGERSSVDLACGEVQRDGTAV